MAIDKATVLKIARLARVAITDDECGPLAEELSQLLAWVEQLKEVDTEAVAPMTSVVEMVLPQRADEVTDGGIRDAILANAPSAEGGFFVVPRVVE